MIWTTTWVLGGTLLSMPAAIRHDGHRLVRAHPRDASELRTVLELADDVWSERVGPGPVEIRVAPGSMAALDASGILYEVRIADVQATVDAEAQRLATGPTPAPAAAPDWFADFRDLSEIEAFMDTLSSEHADLVAIEPVGDSLQGRPIRAVRIGTPAEGKTAVLYTGTMHAREWLATMVATCMANAIALRAGGDDRIDEILDHVVVWIVPVLNPDGYAYSWSGDRYWRKNVREGYGVDLNRNFGYAWGGQGAGTDPWSENYRGSGPFSEPESAALRDFIAARPELVAHIDIHSYASLVLYPWGYGYDTAPDEPALSSLADEMSAAMAQATGASYPAIQGAELYPAAGAVDDWSYGERGLMAFTIELRGDDFVVPPSLIAPACDETLEAALVLAEWAAAQADVPGESDGDGGMMDDGGDASGGETGGAGMGDGPAPSDGDPSAADGGAPPDAESDGGDPADAGERSGALPWDYGDDTASGCTCRQAPRRGWLPALLALIAGVRRRRHARSLIRPIRARSTATESPAARGSSAARAQLAPP